MGRDRGDSEPKRPARLHEEASRWVTALPCRSLRPSAGLYPAAAFRNGSEARSKNCVTGRVASCRIPTRLHSTRLRPGSGTFCGSTTGCCPNCSKNWAVTAAGVFFCAMTDWKNCVLPACLHWIIRTKYRIRSAGRWICGKPASARDGCGCSVRMG